MTTLERLKEPSKIGVFAGTITASGMLTLDTGNGDPSQWMDLSDVDWDRLIVDLGTATTPTGTTPTLDIKVKTVNRTGTPDPTSTTLNATDGSGTAMAMTQLNTLAAREVKGFGRRNSDADGAGVSNIGKYVGLWAEVTGTTPVYAGMNITIWAGK